MPQDAAAGSAEALLARTARAARDAGCRQIEFFSSPQTIQRAALSRAGFLPAPSSVHIFARGGSGGRFEPRVFDLDAWRLVPGDRDAP